MFGFTGNDLKALRGALSLNREDFAQHLGIKANYVRKAERFTDKEIPIDTEEFKQLFDNLCYSAPRMIVIRFDHMKKIQEILQGIARKLQKVDKFLNMGKDPSEENEEEVDEEEKEERQISDTATDKRSVSLDDD